MEEKREKRVRHVRMRDFSSKTREETKVYESALQIQVSSLINKK